MKRAILFFVTPLMLLLFASGCCDCRKQAKFQKPLVGTQWQAVQIMAEDITPEEDSYTLTLHDNGTFTARGTCNNLSGTFHMTTSRALDITPGASTLRMCNDNGAEKRYFEMLDGVTHYEMDGSMMLLLRSGELVGIMQAITE